MKVKINQLLESQGKTRYWLSVKTGITYANITNLCEGKTTRINFEAIDKICFALNCTPSDILEPEPPNND